MYKVLLVDDEPIVKIALRSMIDWEEYGYTICATASDGKEALSLVEKHAPHLIITDLKMPVMDGITLIRTLKEQQFDGEILVISNYEDFDNVRSALVLGAADYLLKVSIETDNLTKHLDTISKRLDSLHKNTNLTLDYKKEQEKNQLLKYQQQLKSYLEDAEYPLSRLLDSFPYADARIKEDYAACYLDFNTAEKEKRKAISDNLISHSLEEAFEDIPDKEIIFLGHNTVLVLLPMASLQKQHLSLEAFSAKLANIFQLYMSVTPIIVFQEYIQGYEALKEWYHTFLHITTLTFYEPLTLIHANAYIPLHYINFIYYKDFARLVQKNNSVHLTDTLCHMNEIVIRCKELHIHPEILKGFFQKVLEVVEYLSPAPSLEAHDYLAELKEAIRTCENSSELTNLVILSLETLFSPAVSVMGKNVSTLKIETKTAIDYINHNYSKRISLASIAEQVNLSPSYLCRLFKSEVGMSITTYMNQLRMEKAGKLLRNSNSNIYMKEISAMVGIDDQLYFSRLFKKYYGVTPSEYRVKQHE